VRLLVLVLVVVELIGGDRGDEGNVESVGLVVLDVARDSALAATSDCASGALAATCALTFALALALA
jgi:hypothetical protein